MKNELTYKAFDRNIKLSKVLDGKLYEEVSLLDRFITGNICSLFDSQNVNRWKDGYSYKKATIVLPLYNMYKELIVLKNMSISFCFIEYDKSSGLLISHSLKKYINLELGISVEKIELIKILESYLIKYNIQEVTFN